MNYDNCLNIGCGNKPIVGWINIDNSPAIKLANRPRLYFLLKALGILNANQIKFVEWNKSNKIVFADITKDIPVAAGKARIIYTSHMLEHLSREDAFNFLLNAREKLSPNGSIRIVVPDLRKLIKDYSEGGNADILMNELMLVPPSINTLKQKLHLLVSGYRQHQWMYDEDSLTTLLKNIGYHSVVSVNAGETTIDDVGNLDLFERQSNSLYIEAKK